MIYCTKCGASLPDDAKFCAKCGQSTGATGGGTAPSTPSAAGASSSPTIAAAGVQEMKCPSCGAPIKPVFGEMVISCEYCGGTVTLGGQGWKEISKHTMLPLKVADQATALKAVHDYIDQGFFHRADFESSTIVEQRLSFVPFWVMPVSASTTYTYQDVAASVGMTAGTIAASALLAGALGGGRGRGLAVVPILAGPVVNPTRSETISGQYEYPVVAVKAMASYQPKDYQFGLTDRTFFDKKAVPDGTPVLNGDLGEDAAKHSAQAFVQQLQSEAAHKKHSMVSQLQTQVQISDAELLHVPIYYFLLDRKGQRTTVLIDASAGRVIRTVS